MYTEVETHVRRCISDVHWDVGIFSYACIRVPDMCIDVCMR